MQKCVVAKVSIFLLIKTTVQQWYVTNGLSAHRHFSTKLMRITARSSTTTHRLYSFEFTLVNKKQFTTLWGCCLLLRMPFSNFVRHFQILYACIHKVSLPFLDQRSRTLVWKWDYFTSKIGCNAARSYLPHSWASMSEKENAWKQG